MEHGLARICVAIHHRAEATGFIPARFCDRRTTPGELADEIIVRGRQIIERRNMTFRDYEYVQRSLRIDVLERNQVVVFMHAFGGKLPGDDFAKQAGHGGEYSPQGGAEVRDSPA